MKRKLRNLYSLNENTNTRHELGHKSIMKKDEKEKMKMKKMNK